MLPPPSPENIRIVARKYHSAIAYADDRLLCRVLGSLKMWVSARDRAMGPHLALDGYWQPGVTSVWLGLVGQAHHVCVVGAGVGYYSLAAASRLAQATSGEGDRSLVMIEPNPRAAQLLRENLALNGVFGAPNWRVCVIDRAVGDADGEQGLLDSPADNDTGGRVTKMKRARVSERSLSQIVVPIDSLACLLAGESRPDIVYIDAYGLEMDVVAGAAKLIRFDARGPTLVIAWRPARFTHSGATAFWLQLTSLGYALSRITDDGGETPVLDQQAFVEPQHDCTLVCRRHPGGAP